MTPAPAQADPITEILRLAYRRGLAIRQAAGNSTAPEVQKEITGKGAQTMQTDGGEK